MCYCNCPHENYHGDCTKGGKGGCPGDPDPLLEEALEKAEEGLKESHPQLEQWQREAIINELEQALERAESYEWKDYIEEIVEGYLD